MLTHMRTTIEVPDAMFEKVKRLAARRKVTLREVVLEGLRLVLETEPRAPRFRLRDAAFGEGGLVHGLEETDWARLRELAYEGRGG